MVKSILFLLSVMLLASDAQLSTVTKRYRVKKETVEFGRASNAVRRSSRGEGQRRIMKAKGGKEPKEEQEVWGDISPFSAEAESLSMGSMPLEPFQMEVSMSMKEIEEEEALDEETEEQTEEEEVESEPVPAPEPIGCNGDEYCPADMKCQCWLFCRFCFFPPCGTCVAN